VIDVKEPDRGPLGRADFAVWTEVRQAVPAGTPVSLALGELFEWLEGDRVASDDGPPRRDLEHDPARYRGFSFRKMGLAGAGGDWVEEWSRLRRHWGAGPSWIAVIYADWERAKAPHPDRVLDVALQTDDCGGVMIDTWDKSRPCPVEPSWGRWLDRARRAGRLTAVAGSIDADSIAQLAPFHPDIIAVRGAACFGGNRRAAVDADRVSRLVLAAAAI
jgi:(5-formylfuran-3-yl)methyl phosphate synthase